MAILGNNVGIGTASPAGILDVKGDGSTDQVFLLSGSGAKASSDESTYTDTNFFVSGTIGSKSTSTKGTSVFGGDTAVSGGLYFINQSPAPDVAATGEGVMYSRAGALYFKNAGGTETALGSGGGGGDTGVGLDCRGRRYHFNDWLCLLWSFKWRYFSGYYIWS